MKNIIQHIISTIKKSGYWIFISLTAFLLISFTNARQNKRVCDKIVIKINTEYQSYFLDESSIENLLTEGNRKIIKGLNQRALDLKYYENLLYDNTFVKYAAISRNYDGGLVVEVTQRKPQVRIIENNKRYYVDNEGIVLPMSKKYSARVPVVFNHSKISFNDSAFFYSEIGIKYINFFNFIQKNQFWTKMIASVEILEKGDINLQLHIGKQKIEFGQPDHIEDKFKKLDFFLKKIVPSKGWNKYERVNLEYENQIVCE